MGSQKDITYISYLYLKKTMFKIILYNTNIVNIYQIFLYNNL